MTQLLFLGVVPVLTYLTTIGWMYVGTQSAWINYRFPHVLWISDFRWFCHCDRRKRMPAEQPSELWKLKKLLSWGSAAILVSTAQCEGTAMCQSGVKRRWHGFPLSQTPTYSSGLSQQRAHSWGGGGSRKQAGCNTREAVTWGWRRANPLTAHLGPLKWVETVLTGGQ